MVSFDVYAENLGIVGADLEMLRSLLAEICESEEASSHDDVARRLLILFHSGMRDPIFLRSLATSSPVPGADDFIDKHGEIVSASP